MKLWGDNEIAGFMCNFFFLFVSTVGDSKKAVGSFDRFRSIDFFQPQSSLTFEGPSDRTIGPIELQFAAKKYLNIFLQKLLHADCARDLLVFLIIFYKFGVFGPRVSYSMLCILGLTYTNIFGFRIFLHCMRFSKLFGVR